MQVSALALAVSLDNNHPLYCEFLARFITILAACESPESMANHPNDHWLVLGNPAQSFQNWMDWQATPGVHVDAVKSECSEYDICNVHDLNNILMEDIHLCYITST